MNLKLTLATILLFANFANAAGGSGRGTGREGRDRETGRDRTTAPSRETGRTAGDVSALNTSANAILGNISQVRGQQGNGVQNAQAIHEAMTSIQSNRETRSLELHEKLDLALERAIRDPAQRAAIKEGCL